MEDSDKIEDTCIDKELDVHTSLYGQTDTGVCLGLAGCGFLGVYHIGALECLQRNQPRMLKQAVVAGASIGAVIGASFLNGVPLSVLKRTVMEAAAKSQNPALKILHPSYSIEELLKAGLNELPQDAHLKANGRLFVSLTKYGTRSENSRVLDRLSSFESKNVMVSNWVSREELVQCLVCSCFIPAFSGLRVPRFRGELYIDGGFTNNLPVVQEPSITISPFTGHADISPRDPTRDSPYKYFSVGNDQYALTFDNLWKLAQSMVPTDMDELEDLYRRGYWDTYNFLKGKGMLSSHHST